jgi:ectoine hydroxylase-related dioxygenase (phytanoyl-CoA dioxygenase family)
MISDLAEPVDHAVPWYMDEARIADKLRTVTDPELYQYAFVFLRDGYVVIPNSVAPEACDEILAEFRATEARNGHLFSPHLDSDGHYPRMINMHLAVPGLRRLFHENRMALALQDLLFGSETVLYTSLFYERGSGQDIHRDTPYFCTRPEYRYFGMWVALEDVDEANGPLMAFTGGHQIAEVDREAMATELFGSPDDAPAMSDLSWNAYQTRVADECRAANLELVTLPVSKGSTILWHPQLPHGGAPIADFSRTRFSLVMHTTPENTPVYYQDAFFNPNKPLPTAAGWSYLEDGGRRFADHGIVGFNHKSNHAIAEFR